MCRMKRPRDTRPYPRSRPRNRRQLTSGAGASAISTFEPSFGIVILNWNNGPDTIACLEALVSCSPPPARVVVVDNGSTDDSLASVESWRNEHETLLPEGPAWLEIIAAGKNLGFAAGSNLGIAHLLAATDVSHVMLLNNDALVTPGFFADLRASLLQTPDAGVTGTTIREYVDRSRVWYAGGIEYPLRALVKHVREMPDTMEPRRTDFVSGCVMIISREVLDRVGLLAECYFPAYFEDGDYCHRARSAGFSVMYAPLPVAYHNEGATVRAAQLALPLVFHKNRLRVIYVRRNYRGFTRFFALTYLLLTKPLRAIADTIQGKPREGWAVFRGAVAGFAATSIGRSGQ